MRKLLLLGLLFLVACDTKSPKQKRIENLVEIYLDSLNNNTPNFEIIRFGNLHATFDPTDHPDYEKYKNDPIKSDSLQKNYKPRITAWVICVTYKGKDGYGNIGTHKYQCVVNTNLSKCIVGIEIE